MDTRRIMSKLKEEEKEKEDRKVYFLLKLDANIRDEAIRIMKRNQKSLSAYLRKCIEELITQHQDNDQPRIESWTSESIVKAWPIPQSDIRVSRFKGWTRKEILEYEDAVRSTLRSLEQARLALQMQGKNYYDPRGENKGGDE